MLHSFFKTLGGSLSALAGIKPIYALSAVSLYVISLFIGGARWKKILSGLGCRARLWETSAGILIGVFVNNVTPLSRVGGELSRITLIRKWAKIDLKKATASILYDRLATVLPTVFLLILSLPILNQIVRHSNYVIAIALSFLLLTAFGVVAYRSSTRVRGWINGKLTPFKSMRIDRQNFSKAVGYGTLLWVQDVLRLMIVAAAFGVILNPYQAATLSLVVVICSLMPSLGGLGPTEGGLTAALHLFGVGLQTAIAITVLERAISYVLGTCAGSIALASVGGKGMLKRSEATIDG